MRVKVAYRQLLHMRKHPVTDCFQHPLSNNHHQPRIDKRCCNSCGIDYGHEENCREESGEYRIFHPNKRRDVIIDKYLHKQGTDNTCKGTDNNTDQNNSEPYSVHACQVPKQPLDRLSRITGSPASGELSWMHTSSSHRRHYASSPFICDRYISWYIALFCNSSSCVPMAQIRPASITRILSASCTDAIL